MVMAMGIISDMDFSSILDHSFSNYFLNNKKLMYFFKFILGVFLFLMFVYYIMVALQLFGVITFTEKEITKKVFIPFYYWFN